MDVEYTAFQWACTAAENWRLSGKKEDWLSYANCELGCRIDDLDAEDRAQFGKLLKEAFTAEVRRMVP